MSTNQRTHVSRQRPGQRRTLILALRAQHALFNGPFLAHCAASQAVMDLIWASVGGASQLEGE